MDLLKDLRAALTLAPMQCDHVKANTVYFIYDAILFFVCIYRI